MNAATHRSPGHVYWFTGLAGAGKSTLGSAFAEELRRRGRVVVLLDGDDLRAVLGPHAGYAPDDRRALARSYGRLCKLLADQGLDVVCATISLFHEVQRWNRAHIPGYREILVRAPAEVLRTRDQKQLYSGVAAGTASAVVGLDLVAEEPEQPDAVVNNGGEESPGAIVARLTAALLCEDGGRSA